MPDLANLISVTKLAVQLDCSVSTIYRLIKNNPVIRPYKIGNRTLFLCSDVERWLEGTKE